MKQKNGKMIHITENGKIIHITEKWKKIIYLKQKEWKK